MCNQTLRELLVLANSCHNQDALQLIVLKFTPIIRKMSRQLAYEEVESDLIIFLLEFVFKLELDKIQLYSEGQLVNFIVRALKNKRVDIYRKNLLKFDYIHNLNLPATYDFTEMLCLYETVRVLEKKQRNIVMAKYFYGYSDIEIAQKLHVSRQYVNKLRRKAVENLSKAWTQET